MARQLLASGSHLYHRIHSPIATLSIHSKKLPAFLCCAGQATSRVGCGLLKRSDSAGWPSSRHQRPRGFWAAVRPTFSRRRRRLMQ